MFYFVLFLNLLVCFFKGKRRFKAEITKRFASLVNLQILLFVSIDIIAN